MTPEEFESAVIRDLIGNASEDDMDALEADLQQWKDALASMIMTLMQKLTAKKHTVSMAEYSRFRGEILKEKNIIDKKIRDVKAMLKEQNVEDNSGRYIVMNDLHMELKEIRALLTTIVERGSR